jgi:hypothetical protein
VLYAPHRNRGAPGRHRPLVWLDAAPRKRLDLYLQSTHILRRSECDFRLNHKRSSGGTYHPDRGWYHKKGRFGPGKRTKPTVITEAVLHHISTGKGIADFVEQVQDIRDFLFSSTVRGENVEEIRHGAAHVQRTNRWYRSRAGRPIEKCIRSTDGTTKWSKVADSDSCVVVNTLCSFSVPQDLDRGYYITAAERLLRDIDANRPPSEVIQSKLIAAAIKAQALGLTIVPKGRPGNEKANVPCTYDEATIRYWQETPLDAADWKNYEGFGAYTGRSF